MQTTNTITIEQRALNVLDSYEGFNNYILKLKQKKEVNKNFFPTKSQSEYIINYEKVIPKVAKKFVDLDPYFAKKIADEKLFSQIPKKVWIEKLLVEKDKAYHFWGRFFDSESFYDFWLPKSAVIKTHKTEMVEIDYTKYSNRPPLSHQKEAIEKLVGTKRFILADDMGLGKTTSTIIAALESKSKKILIICPASLKINWSREIQNYTDRSIFICEGKNFSTEHDFVIVNYDILKNFYDIKNKEESQIFQYNPDLIIIDEAHYLQNAQAQRTKLVNHFAKKTERLWLLTGTPMTSRPINYFNLLNLIESPVSNNWMAYAIRYCEGYQFRIGGGRKVWNVNGASNLEELRERTSHQILRRLKEEILDLPEKIITPVYLKLKSKLYEDLMGEYYDWYDKKNEESSSLTIQFSKLTKVRQVIAKEKVESTVEIANNILEQGKKVIIFTNFTETLNLLVEHFKDKCVFLDGSCSNAQRQKAVDDFQNKEKVKVFIGNLKAAGVGLTLTAAEAVIMNDLSFVPAELQQGEDRAYRYGQKNSVSVFYPIFENTIEGIIYDIIAKKKQIIRIVMGDGLPQDSSIIVEEILQKINEIR